MSGQPKAYADLADLQEDERIDMIGRLVTEQGHTVGVVLENDQEKIERYAKKLISRFPGLRIASVGPGLVSMTVLMRVAPFDPSRN